MASGTVPLKLRKQVLQMRAAVERVEFVHHLNEVRRAATVSAIVRNALPNARSRSWVSRGVDLAKRYPFITSAASLVASRFKIPLFKSAVKWGGVATLGYKLWDAWQAQQRTTRMRRRGR